MIISSIRRAIGGLLATTLALGATLTAVQPAAAQQYAVPGAPGVADVSVVRGDVVIVRGDSGVQVGAAINTPMLPGDYISTADGSRAEVQFDGISMIRLAQDTQVRIVNLDPSSREVQLASGTAELAVLQGGDGGSQIDTPSVTVRPDQSGDYRVSVLSNGETLVTVRSGVATVFSGNASENLTPGTTLVAYGDYNAPQISMQAPIGYDAFDTFNQRRDQDVVASYNSNPYLAPALAGYADFANDGQWYNVPGYGESWAPYNQGNNWSPYSNGQWIWEPGYGYTWVGNESWGYVPYHYGNWYYAQNYNQWMWQPPGYQYQNPSGLASAWLPAMVAFFLSGGNGNAALNAAFNPYQPYGYGNIGWVPLAPGEQYVPWYAGFGANAAFPQTTLSPVSNVTNIYNVYRNIRYIKVVRVIDIRRFRDGDFSHAVTMPARDLSRHIAIVRGAVPIVPTKAALGVKRAPTAVRLSSHFEQPVFAKKAAEIVHTASFDRQASALKTVVAAKPRVESVPVRTTAVSHPVYQAPVERRTYKAPVQVAKPAAKPAVKTEPKPVTIPEAKPVTIPEAKPVTKPETKPETKPAAPQQFAPPEQRHVMPERTMTPERTAAPQQFAPPEQRRNVAPERTMVPERTMAPESPQRYIPPQQQRMPENTMPQRTAQPQRFAPEQQRVTPPPQVQHQAPLPQAQQHQAPPQQRSAPPPSQAPPEHHPKATASPAPL